VPDRSFRVLYEAAKRQRRHGGNANSIVQSNLRMRFYHTVTGSFDAVYYKRYESISGADCDPPGYASMPS
jgi:hypothetical protein